jgi:predicted acylesterase/phospholipase RssA
MSESAEPRPYAPQLRTALVLTGTGTAGAYHAGVLRALHEAGVKLDIVAGRGIGAVSALFAAIDGGQSLWSERGFWRVPGVKQLYPWRLALRVFIWAIAFAVLIVAVPLAAVAAGAIVFPIDFVVRLVGLGGVSGLTGEYVRLTQQAFAPDGLPTWLPRLVVLVLGAAAGLVVWDAMASAGRRQQRGSFWWRAAGSPLSSREVVAHSWRSLWDLLRGAAPLRQPAPTELARRYADLLVDNIGQPGFRELLLTVHDLDAHRDLVFALVAEARRRDLIRRPSTTSAEARRAEVLDLSGAGRSHLADAVAASLAVPIATEPHEMTFAPDAYWRGETHRLCDRAGSLTRILEELADLGVEQAVIVSASPELIGPHALTAHRLDGKGRLGEYLQSAEAAAVRDATRLVAARTPRISTFVIRPGHNPVGPFDFSGGYDVRSDRQQPLTELMSLGYEDAYHQFVEPVVGASGERVGVRDGNVERRM